MQRPWLAHYPAGVPAEIGHDYPRTLAQLIEEALERYAERTAVTFLSGHITYRQLDHASRAASAWLVQHIACCALRKRSSCRLKLLSGA